MKFQKFVKTIGSEGIIYVRENGEKWLASGTVFMKIPDDIRSVTASDIVRMPNHIENIINYENSTDPCMLYKAIMPNANSGIKDCIRVYATENLISVVGINNTDYSLIENGDNVEMYTSSALLIKNFSNSTGNLITVGVIFPTEYEEV